MKSWIVQVTVMVVMISVGSTALAQMGKDGMGKSGMMGGGGMGMHGPGMEMGGGMMGGGGMGMMGMHGPGMEMGGIGQMMKMMRTMSMLTLTPDQKKKLQLATLQHQKEAIPLLGQILIAGVEIQELLLVDPADLDKVKSKVKEKYDAAAKLEMSHMALRQEVKKMLSPEQRQQMESMMMEMGPMMGSMKEGSTGQATEESESGGGTNSQAGKGLDPKDPHGH
jgi:Spy/CpxP family protein refolding chaperone